MQNKLDKRTTRNPDYHGSKNPHASLNETQILIIRDLYAMGARPKPLADLFRTTRHNISNIVARRTWRHI